MNVRDDRYGRALADCLEAGDSGLVGERYADDVASRVRKASHLVERGIGVKKVGVDVMDCTTTGAPPPIVTPPTFTGRVLMRGRSATFMVRTFNL